MSNLESGAGDSIPARMLNEFAYCPRLFYLEHVQCEWAHSADTLDGRFVHRRVDDAKGRAPAPEDITPDTRIHARSVTLGSVALGATATIDLLEGEDGRVTPVDYKRGSPPNVPERAWEPERVQVCLQAMLLRENGYACDRAVLYFAESQTRVDVEITPELVGRTRELLAAARSTARSGRIPDPLVDSPKCPRCSLVGICLPDEVNLLKSSGALPDESSGAAVAMAVAAAHVTTPTTQEPRRLVPARDDKIALYVQGQGLSVGLKGEVLEIRERGKTVDEARLMDLSQVNLFGNVQLSAQALRELAAREIVVLHMSYGGWLAAVTTPPPHKNIELRRSQFETAASPAECLKLARSFVSGKIRNCRTLLRRNARDLPDDALWRLRESRRHAEQASALASLLGIEGTAAREYFGHFPRMLKAEGDAAAAFDFATRNRRPPRDPINALLSFVYAMLAKDLVATLVGVGLDPYLGFYHQPRYGRPALALDLMEEFRPLVADSTVVNLVNNGEIRPSDFVERGGSVALTSDGRRRVIEAYERRLDQLVTHPRFGYSIGYRRVFEVQARLLGRRLTGEIPDYPPFCTR